MKNVTIFIFSTVFMFMACTPTALLDTIERNPAYAIPQPPKTKQLKLVIALNGNYDMGNAAAERLMAYYQISYTLEVYEKLTVTTSEY